MDTNSFSFGYWLRWRRKARDLTQEELAQRAGCARGTIKNIEADVRRPSKQLAARLASALELTADERDAFVKAARAEVAADRLVVSGEPMLLTLSGRTAVDNEAAIGIVTPVSPAELAVSLPTGTVTFLFTDIAGSTQLWEQHGQAMRAALARHDTILREAITTQAGVVFHLVGDAFCAAFARATDALSAALAAQRALHAERWRTTGPLRVRMAVHTGVVEPAGDDYLGLPLSRVARVLAAGHGSQVLFSLATAELVREHLPPDVDLRDLGIHHLKDLSHPEQIFQLVAPDLPADFPPLRTSTPFPSSAAASSTSFIGRATELAEITALLEDAACRLLTLVGLGGIGKTRIAETIVVELNRQTAGSAYFVPLAALNDAERLAAAILCALGIPLLGSVDPQEQLLAALRRRNILIVLDNFEHLRSGTSLLVDILQQARGVNLLVTSRVRLELSMEHTYQVRALAIPGPHRQEDLEQYSAVQLFVQRTRQARPTFELTPRNARDVGRICRLVGGIPLGIELAASWMHILSCATIATELASSIDILTTTFQDVPERHRSMRAVMDQSWRLLTPIEQRTLRRLSVFRGGFRLDVAAEVVGAERKMLRETLGRLSAKSLITLDEMRAAGQEKSSGRSGHTQRRPVDAGEEIYTMHAVTRQYGREQLCAAGEEQAIRDHHLAAMIALAERWAPEFHATEQADAARSEATRQLTPMIDDQRAALEWAIQTGRVADDGWRLAGALAWYWYFEGHWSEGRQWLHTLLDGGPAEVRSSARAKALYVAAVLDWYQDDFATAQRYIGEALQIWQDDGDAQGLVLALAMQGLIALLRGDLADAMASFDAGIATGRQLGDRWGLALTFTQAGLVPYALDQTETARARFTEGLAYFRTMQDSWGEQLALSHLGDLALRIGEIAEAERCYEQVLAIAKTTLRTNDLNARAFHGLGCVALAQNSYDLALERLLHSLTIAQDLNMVVQYPMTLCALAGVALGKGMPERSAWFLGAADSVRHLVDHLLHTVGGWHYQNIKAQAQAELGDVAFQAALEAGRKADFAHAFDVAVQM